MPEGSWVQEEDLATQTFNRDLLKSFTADEILIVMRQTRRNLQEAPDTPGHSELLHRLDFRIDLLETFRANATGLFSSSRNDRLLSLLTHISKSVDSGKPVPSAFSIKIQRQLASSVPPRPMIVCPLPTSLDFTRRLLKDIAAAFEIPTVTSASDLYTAFWTFTSQTPTPCVYLRSLVQSFLTLSDRILGTFSPEQFIAADMRALVLPSSSLLDLSTTVEVPSDPRFTIRSQISSFITKISPSFTNQFRSFALNRPRVRRNLCHAAVEWDNIQAEAEDLDAYLQTLSGEIPLPYGSISSDTATTNPDNTQNPDDDSATAYAYPLSSWVYHYKLQQMRLVTQLGFELEIYGASEFVDMHWYLAHVASLHLAHLERISFFVSRAPVPGNHPLGSGLGVTGQAALDDHRAKTHATQRRLYAHFSRLKATDTLASALQRVFLILKRHHLLGHQGAAHAPKRSESAAAPTLSGQGEFAGGSGKGKPAGDERGTTTYSTDALRNELRMRPFRGLSVPEPLAFGEMARLAKLEHLSDGLVLEQAARLVATARRAWEEVARGSWVFDPLVRGGFGDGDGDGPGAVADGRGGQEEGASGAGLWENNGKGRGMGDEKGEGVGEAETKSKNHKTLESEWKRDVTGCLKACIATGIAVVTLTKAVEEGPDVVARLLISVPGVGEEGRFHCWWAVPKISRG
jgi:N-alpha-acetyltransferase 35, NatC auxiliary subunit